MDVDEEVRKYLRYVPTQERFEESVVAEDEFYAPYSMISIRLPHQLSMNQQIF